MIPRLTIAIALFVVAGCTKNSLPLEGTSWIDSVGNRKLTFNTDGTFTLEQILRKRTSEGTYRTNSDTLSLKFKGTAIWDPGTNYGYLVTLSGNSMTLRQSSGDGPALTTQGEIINLTRVP